MRKRADVVVVGAGVVALAVAEELLSRQHTVTLVGPRHRHASATRAAGAMLSTFSELEPGHTPARVAVDTGERLAAAQRYPAWLDRLRTQGEAGLHAPAGTWVIARPGHDGALQPMHAAAQQAGHSPELHDARTVPGIRPPAGATALWLPTEARIDTALLLDALTAVVDGHERCTWHDSPAVAVDGATVRCADGTQIEAATVVLAAGAATSALLPAGGQPLGVPPVLAGRGASLLLERPGDDLPFVVRTPNEAFACGVHLVPRADGRLYLGGTNRLTITPDPHTPATLDEIGVLLSATRQRLHAGIGAAGLSAHQTGLRPYTLDHQPMVGPTTDPRLLLATGTYRSGVLLAPRLAALIADEITAPGALNAHPYRVLRPMPEPDPSGILHHGAGTALLEHLAQTGAVLPEHATAQLAALINAALPALLTAPDGTGAALRRLWHAAPVTEAVPALVALLPRLRDADHTGGPQ